MAALLPSAAARSLFARFAVGLVLGVESFVQGKRNCAELLPGMIVDLVRLNHLLRVQVDFPGHLVDIALADGFRIALFFGASG
jgi:hypothetical protein